MTREPWFDVLTERERELLERYEPVIVDGRVLTDRAQERLIRDADQALIADYAARIRKVANSQSETQT